MEAGWGEGEGVLGSLSNDDDDGNKNGKKTIGLDWQNNNFARASCFLVHFFAVIAWLREHEHKTATSFIFFWTLIQSFRIKLKKNWWTSDKLKEME